jgi:hypothetical protein
MTFYRRWFVLLRWVRWGASKHDLTLNDGVGHGSDLPSHVLASHAKYSTVSRTNKILLWNINLTWKWVKPTLFMKLIKFIYGNQRSITQVTSSRRVRRRGCDCWFWLTQVRFLKAAITIIFLLTIIFFLRLPNCYHGTHTPRSNTQGLKNNFNNFFELRSL